MSNENKKPDAADDAPETDEISEEQLESVSGGILIGLNQPSVAIKFDEAALGHKDLVGLSPTTVPALTHKFFKQ